MSRIVIEKDKVSVSDLGQRRRVEIFKDEDSEDIIVRMCNTHRNTESFMIVSKEDMEVIVKALPDLLK